MSLSSLLPLLFVVILTLSEQRESKGKDRCICLCGFPMYCPTLPWVGSKPPSSRDVFAVAFLSVILEEPALSEVE